MRLRVHLKRLEDGPDIKPCFIERPDIEGCAEGKAVMACPPLGTKPLSTAWKPKAPLSFRAAWLQRIVENRGAAALQYVNGVLGGYVRKWITLAFPHFML